MRPEAFRYNDHYVVSNAPLARDVAYSRELNDLLSSVADYVAPTSLRPTNGSGNPGSSNPSALAGVRTLAAADGAPF